jgi:hypothetical protein
LSEVLTTPCRKKIYVTKQITKPRTCTESLVIRLREEQRLRALENSVLRRISGEWRRLHNEELNDLYSSPNIGWVIKSRKTIWAGHVARMGEKRGTYRILVGRPEGRRPLHRPRHRWEDNIKMNLQEVGRGAWIGLRWLRIGTGLGLL